MFQLCDALLITVTGIGWYEQSYLLINPEIFKSDLIKPIHASFNVYSADNKYTIACVINLKQCEIRIQFNISRLIWEYRLSKLSNVHI